MFIPDFLANIFLWPQISQNVKLFYFWTAQEKNLGQISKNQGTFYPKSCHKALKNEFGIRDPRSGIRNKPIPDPGSATLKIIKFFNADPWCKEFGSGMEKTIRIREKHPGSATLGITYNYSEKWGNPCQDMITRERKELLTWSGTISLRPPWRGGGGSRHVRPCGACAPRSGRGGPKPRRSPCRRCRCWGRTCAITLNMNIRSIRLRLMNRLLYTKSSLSKSTKVYKFNCKTKIYYFLWTYYFKSKNICENFLQLPWK